MVLINIVACGMTQRVTNGEWLVRGLSVLNRNRRGGCVEIANYRGKLLILWDRFVNPGRLCQ